MLAVYGSFTDNAKMTSLSEAAERNKAPIGNVLAELLPEEGTVLEVASGTGQHILYFAERFSHLNWQASDRKAAVPALTQRLSALSRPNCLPPIELDVLQPWPSIQANFVFCANMIHIAIPETTPALFKGVAGVLSPGSGFLLYGPFRLSQGRTAPSNLRFESWLKSLNPEYGLKSLDWLQQLALSAGLTPIHTIEMPANNHCLFFRRAIA